MESQSILLKYFSILAPPTLFRWPRSGPTFSMLETPVVPVNFSILIHLYQINVRSRSPHSNTSAPYFQSHRFHHPSSFHSKVKFVNPIIVYTIFFHPLENLPWHLVSAKSTIQEEGIAVASIARDDPSPLPGMHRDHNAFPSQTDGQTDGRTDTDIVAKARDV